MLVLDAHIQGSLREKWKKYMYLFIAICIGSGAVLYLENEEGFEYPQIDEKKCIKCYQCLKVCPFKET